MSTPTPAEIDRYIALARIALRHYNLVDPAVEFLRLNENLTFRVTTATSREHYLLRLHRSAPSNFLVQSPASLESELLWLDALARDTAITVQRPVRNRRGRLVTAITPIGESTPLLCSLLTWIDGEPFRQDAPNAPQLAERLGELIAKLHNHAATWDPPRGFTRVTFGLEFLKRTVMLLKGGVEQRLFSPQDFAILDETADRIRSLIAPLPRDRQCWGLIQADLQGSNILAHEGDVRPIDFSLCGFGHFLFDLGIAVPSLKPHLREPLLEGYRRGRPLPDSYIQTLEVFALFSMFNCYAFLLPDPACHDWIHRRVPVVAATHCRALLAGEPFLAQL
jgi:Ser/Thr protein kinase RdoA (MazF antagonist)